MKTIAMINFKGGVGKTTCTWALGHVAAQSPASTSLIFDLDAQMSLTTSIALNEAGRDFTDWHDRAVAKKKTIFDALDEFTKADSRFNFGINHDFIYRIRDRYHFVPSSVDLYWTELEVFDREKVKFFIRRLLEKIPLRLLPASTHPLHRLFGDWDSGNEIEVEKELEAMKADELRRFADANHLNVTSKTTKPRVMALIAGRFHDRRQLLRSNFKR